MIYNEILNHYQLVMIDVMNILKYINVEIHIRIKIMLY